MSTPPWDHRRALPWKNPHGVILPSWLQRLQTIPEIVLPFPHLQSSQCLSPAPEVQIGCLKTLPMVLQSPQLAHTKIRSSCVRTPALGCWESSGHLEEVDGFQCKVTQGRIPRGGWEETAWGWPRRLCREQVPGSLHPLRPLGTPWAGGWWHKAPGESLQRAGRWACISLCF